MAITLLSFANCLRFLGIPSLIKFGENSYVELGRCLIGSFIELIPTGLFSGAVIIRRTGRCKIRSTPISELLAPAGQIEF
jgi:hypothetical protein